MTFAWRNKTQNFHRLYLPSAGAAVEVVPRYLLE